MKPRTSHSPLRCSTKHCSATSAAFLLALFLIGGVGLSRDCYAENPPELLWKIGEPDNGSSEFAWGPADYSKYHEDGQFLVGQSSPAEDWPYVHPGPDDYWAEGRSHAFKIYFALDSLPEEDRVRLVIDLVDTHDQSPPELVFTLNEYQTRHQTPAGGPDASIRGDAEAGKEHRFYVPIPVSALREGLNELTITNVSGSWMIYDYLALEAPENMELGELRGAAIQQATAEPYLMDYRGEPVQYLRVTLLRLDPNANMVVTTDEDAAVELPPTNSTKSQVFLRLNPVDEPKTTEVVVKQDEVVLDRREVERGPVRMRKPVDWVDPLLGTGSSRWMLTPGPWLPMSMVKLSPVNEDWKWKGGYEYTLKSLRGFDHVHSWTMAGLLCMPTTGPLKTNPGPIDDPDAGYRSRIDKSTEKAGIGFYEVVLEDYGIKAELTATNRAGLQRYTFPESDSARVLIDLNPAAEAPYTNQMVDGRIERTGDTELVGFSRFEGRGGSAYQDYTLHFVLQFSQPFESFGGWVDEERIIAADDEQIVPGDEVRGEGDMGAFVAFAESPRKPLLIRSGISLVSVEQARLNLERELNEPFGWNFEAVVQHQRDVWSDLFARVQVDGGTPDDFLKFYSNFYRAYCARTIWSDVNGKYVDMNEKVRQLDNPEDHIYGCDAFWNTFWNLNQLWTLATPEVTDKWVRSLLTIYDDGGWLAKGPTGVEYSSIMVASHEIALIVAAYQHGIRNFDIDKAWEAVRHIQTTPAQLHPGGGHVGNRQLTDYLQHGYVPHGRGPTSNTMEYAYDDWCVAQFAKALGKKNEYEVFRNRAGYWKNVFDNELGFIRPRLADGGWLEPFDPFQTGGFVEANAWQYTWFVPQDVHGLIEEMGSKRFVERLDEGMRISEKTRFNAPGDRMATVPINHGNQPTMQVAYLFNYAGAPWLTQKWARSIMDRYYGHDPLDGWPGDEDQGQMGAWFVMSAMGLFQTDGGCRVNPIYEIGSPLFERVEIQLDPAYYPGGKFVIEARGNSPQNVYVQSASLNGEPLERTWLTAKEIQSGGKLLLEMGPEPNRQWGSASSARPPRSE